MEYEIPTLTKRKLYKFKHPRWFTFNESAKTVGERISISTTNSIKKAVSNELVQLKLYNSGDILGNALRYPGYCGGGKLRDESKNSNCNELFVQEFRCIGRGLKFTGICGKHARERIEDPGIKTKPVIDPRLIIPIIYLFPEKGIEDYRKARKCSEIFESKYVPVERPDNYKNTLLELKFKDFYDAPEPEFIIIGEGQKIKNIPHIELDNSFRYELLNRYPHTIFIEIRSNSECRFALTKNPGTAKNPDGTTRKKDGQKVQLSGEDYRGFYVHEILAGIKTVKFYMNNLE